MIPLEEPQLAAHLARRSIKGTEAQQIVRSKRLADEIRSRIGAEAQARHRFGGAAASWLSVLRSGVRVQATLGALLVIAALAWTGLLSGGGPRHPGPGDSSPGQSPATASSIGASSPSITADTVQVLTEKQLEEVVGGSGATADIGRVVIADVQILLTPSQCSASACATEYSILGTANGRVIGVDVGELDFSLARAPFALRIVAPFAVQLIAQVGSPSSSGVSMTVAEYRTEILNQRLQPTPERTVPIAFVVDAWLETQVSTRACPLIATIPPLLTDFTCGGWSWLTPAPFEWSEGLGSPPPGGLLVQNAAYADFASDPVIQASPPLAEPRRGLYLIAPAHTQGGTCSIDCEAPNAGSVLARVDPVELAPSPEPTALSSHAEMTLGAFRLSFDLPKTTWTSSESITGISRLEYLGSGPSAMSGSIGGPLGFELNELNGSRHLGVVYDDACSIKSIGKGFALTASLRKDGGYDADLPSASFYASFFADPQYRLPPGDWELTAWADFETDPQGCSGPEYKLKATIGIHVISATEMQTPLPSSADLAAGLTYYCGNGERFDIESLSGPANAEQSADPAVAPLRSLAPQLGLEPTHWWSVYRSTTAAEFLGRTSSGPYDYVVIELRGDGSWGLKGYGDCQMQYVETGLSTIAWSIDPANPPTPGTRELHVLARDLCPGTLARRLGKPVIRYGVDSILIALTASLAAPGGPGCGTGQTAAFTLQLDEPIGARTLIDGSIWPSRDARIVPPQLSGAGG